MRRFWILCLCVVLFVNVAGCAARPIAISTIASDFLRSCNVSNSSIIAMDFSYFDRYTPEQRPFDYWYIYDLFDDLFSSYCDYHALEKEAASNHDVILAAISFVERIEGDSGEKKEVYIKIGSGEFNHSIERRLIGSSVGDKFDVILSEDGIGAYPQTAGKTVSVEVLSIGEYLAGEDTEKTLLSAGLSSLDEFYHYLYEAKRFEADIEYYAEKKISFFKDVFNVCEFALSEEDLKAYSLQVANEYDETARSLDMKIEELYTDILEKDENSFFLMCTESADYEIKKCLVTGALAVRFGIETDDTAFEKYCADLGVQTTDENTLIAARYSLLETMVLKNFGIINNRVVT